MQFHRLLELCVAFRLGSHKGLHQRFHWFLHQTDTDPFTFRRGDYGTVLGAVDAERSLSHSIIGLIRYLDHGCRDRSLFISVLVIKALALLHYRFEIPVDGINGARGMHPTTSLVEALVDEELSPRCRAVGVQTLVARHV